MARVDGINAFIVKKMAKEDPIDQTLQKAIAVGQSNLRLMPSVKNWCRHLVLEDVSRGMVTQVYRLPTMLSISCPHASGRPTGGMLDWIAASFIGEHCQKCIHHDPVVADNFGSELLKTLKNQEEEKKKAVSAEKAHKERLQKEIADLAKKEIPKAGISQLSVLKYVDSLSESEKRSENAKLLVEAAKIEPGFFNLVALQGIAYYFDDKAAGSLLLEAVTTVFEYSPGRPAFVFDRAVEALRKFQHLNAVCSLLQQFITAANLEDHVNTIRLVISQCRYERHFEKFGHQKEYSGALELLSYLIDQDTAFMLRIFRDILAVPAKNARINTHYLLQELYSLQSGFVHSLLPEIVQSLEGEDDEYMDSADRVNLTTIALIIQNDPNEFYPKVETLFGHLSHKALASTLNLPRIILSDDEFCRTHDTFCQSLIDQFIEKAFAKPLREIRDEAQELRNLAHNRPQLFQSHFNGLLGMLIKIYDERRMFDRFLEEVKHKPPDKHTTYNYLTGKESWAIMDEETTLDSILHAFKGAIKHIMEHDPVSNGAIVRELTKSLDSSNQENVKAELIGMLSSAIKDPLVVIGLLPDLYTYLLDPSSANVRYASIGWLGQIMDRFPSLVTQSLLDLLDVFLSDSDVIIRVKSIRLLETLAKRMPSHFTPTHVELIIDSLLDKFIGIHQSATNLCHILFEQITPQQRNKIFNSLMGLETVYRDEDGDFYKTIVQQMLRCVSKYPNTLDFVVKNYVVPGCGREKPASAEDFRQILDEIREEFPRFEKPWLEVTLDFLEKTHIEFADDGDRASLFNKMYQLSYATVNECGPQFEKFLQSRLNRDAVDILWGLDVLSYFEQHSVVIELSEHFQRTIPDLESTKGLLDRCRLRWAISSYDQSRSSGSALKKQLELIDDARQKI